MMRIAGVVVSQRHLHDTLIEARERLAQREVLIGTDE